MREFNHALTLSKSKKSAMLKVEINDQYGKQIINLSSVRSWRKDLAIKHLKFECKNWDIESARAYIGLEVLKSAKDIYEANRLLEVVKSLNNLEIHFWASKLLTNSKTRRAFRLMYR